MLRFHPQVQQAMAHGRAIVALESTIISHGMPYPQNVQTARQVERIVRENGAEPATIAIMDGQIHIGLGDVELERLGKQGQKHATKTSRRDLSRILFESSHSPNIMGATTVSGTMVCADMAGIDVFVTGGIGGVHRGAESTMDISADLTELGRTPVAVVCAGVKSILDIGRTLEYLETQGVPVATLSPEDHPFFPSFYTPTSSFKSPMGIKSVAEAAGILYRQKQMKLKNGIVFAVPIPAEHAHDSALIQKAIDQALLEAESQGITGKDSTPFLLKRVAELTKGSSLKSNIELVKNNAKVGAQIAQQYSKLRSTVKLSSHLLTPMQKGCPLFVGGSAIDLICKLDSSSKDFDKTKERTWEHFLHTSTPGKLSKTLGGVARNAAEACHRCLLVEPSLRPALISPLAGDDFGKEIISKTAEMGMDTENFVVESSFSNESTPIYNALLDPQGRLIAAGADMGLLTKDNESLLTRVKSFLANTAPSILVLDGNLNQQITSRSAKAAGDVNIPVLFEPTSVSKASKNFEPLCIQGSGAVRYISPNVEELLAMSKLIPPTLPGKNNWQELQMTHIKASREDIWDKYSLQFHESGLYKDAKEWMPELLKMISVVPTVFLKLGSKGMLLAQLLYVSDLYQEAEENSGSTSRSSLQDREMTHLQIFDNPAYWEKYQPGFSENIGNNSPICFRWYSPEEGLKIVNVTGAGDCLVGAAAAGMTLALHRFPSQISTDSRILPKVWEQMSPVAKHCYLFSNARLAEREALMDEICLKSRKAAELTLQSELAVHKDISKLYI